MTTPIPSQRESLVSALVAMMHIEWFMLLVWVMTLVCMILQDRADRQYAAERHHEVMESLTSTRANITQSIQFHQRQGRFEEIREHQNER